MVTIIKNQLLKHLSRYTKNLSPEQISLSAFKGSGELQDITLDEDVLTDLLELPGWLRLTSAKCNRASFRIQWTKLKSVPIVLNLDEVHIALEVCSEPRTMNPDAASAMPAPGKYSYIHKAIDGISVMVNQVQIDFSCDAFSSSVQITRVTVESRTPDGRKGDLRSTRIKSPDTGQLLLFKEVEWQSVRIEAKPKGSAAANLPPLRLLLGNTLCRIVIKKRLSDCSVLGSRLVLQPEAVAWALTDGQLRAALSCAQALAQPVKKATQQATRTKALKKVEQPLEQIHSRSAQNENDLYARLFEKYDVKETSYHLLASRIDLHLCDDPGLGRSEKPLLSNGGALQVTLLGMQADFFPYHRASSDRRHWRGYRESATPHTQWLSQALSQFCSSLLESLDPRPMTPTPNANQERREPMSNGVPHFTTDTNNSASSNPSNQNTTSQGSPTRTKVLQQLGKLMSTCLILRIDNFTVYKVSKGLKSREPPRPLVSAEKATMPGDAGLLHAELTHFYYPGDVCFPVPPPKFYSQMSPVRISVDPDSLVWLAAFFRHVAQSLVDVAPANGPFYMDVRCEAIMPKIVFEAGSEHVPQQRDRPREMQICTARANFTNVREHARTDAPGTRADLASTLSLLRRSAPSSGQFPTSEDDVSPLHEAFMLHADCLDDIERGPELDSCWLWRENRSVWCFRAEPLWVELCHARATPKPTTLLDAIPITAWIYLTEDFSRIWVAAKTCGLACLQLNHYQLLFLLRTMEKISDMMAWLAHDAARDPLSKDSSIVVGIYAPAAEMSIVLPSTCPGQESSRDLDSVPLDSSSLQDMRMGSDITMAPSNIDRDSGVVANSTVHFTNISSNEYMHPMQPIPIPITTTAVESLPSNSVAYFSGVSSMFRGFNSLVSSIDMSLSRDDTRSDAASTASSDSERYVVLGLTADSPHDADVAFREFEHGRCSSGVEMGVEVAADIIERSSSPSDHSITSCCRRRDLISTCSFHLNNIHMVHQSVKEKTTLRLVADDLKSEECSSMPWDEFQDKFSMRARAFVEPTFDGDEFKPRVSPKVAARLNRTVLETPPRIKDEPATLAECDQLLEAQLRDLSIALNMSTALSLAEFIEDEVVIQPMPLEVLLENLKLHIKEDRQARSISSPPPQPIDITLNDIRLTRDTSGVLHLGPLKSVAKTSDENIAENVARTNIELELLSRENEELKKRLNTLSRIAEDNRELRAKVEEASLLRQCVHAAQQETESLLADKLQLLTTIRCLQDQLNSRGKR